MLQGQGTGPEHFWACKATVRFSFVTSGISYTSTLE
jgi:hypothetical protein